MTAAMVIMMVILIIMMTKITKKHTNVTPLNQKLWQIKHLNWIKLTQILDLANFLYADVFSISATILSSAPELTTEVILRMHFRIACAINLTTVPFILVNQPSKPSVKVKASSIKLIAIEPRNLGLSSAFASSILLVQLVQVENTQMAEQFAVQLQSPRWWNISASFSNVLFLNSFALWAMWSIMMKISWWGGG